MGLGAGETEAGEGPSAFRFQIQLARYVRAKLIQSCPRLFVTPWTVARQAPLSMGFSRREYGVGCHFLLWEVFPTQGLNPCLKCLLSWQPVALLRVPPGNRDAECDMLCTLKPCHPFEKYQSAGWDERGLASKWKTNKQKRNNHPPQKKKRQRYQIFKPTFETEDINLILTDVQSMK